MNPNISATKPTTGRRFERAVSIMARLRGPDGCPWDREQTFDSIKPYAVEETYEVLEAIDNRDWDELPGELGDLLLQVLFYSQMADEQGRFSIDDVLDRLSDKLVSRHPHVFGDVKAATSSDVLRNWDAIKQKEKEQKRLGEELNNEQGRSLLDGVSKAMPALLEAHKLSSQAAKTGFDWPNIGGVFDKLQEETEELRQEVREARDESLNLEARRTRLEEELGDLFFALVNLARHLALDPESALKRTNRKFRQRFQWMERELRLTGRGLEDAPMEELESLWQEAKKQSRSGTTSES
ncbi:MAG: nucleoside triphosphate pyrophosphohydrolase [Terriglobales bacterium]